ncbi:Apolipoprotein N-acyltransferase [Candidatus Nitrospira nitrosa]|uniref:Apolipoprotein N-acyltransferase n=1 Tax=Candidatus Nitrospira nitrosa TaxID=1742972 RepID=A0A0S4LFE5_9BACT|nr:apolipoprotein N-acyltransferase [Candidatus Nitrospira nitrosa]CUS35967.1 Apolipoprotein N-acyltransferase [Candidatus Nitrospira nitrosa]
MDGARSRQLIFACASGLFLPLCFPKFDLGLLAWIVLIPLHLALDQCSKLRAFWIGWLSGLIGFTGIMAWVVTAMTTYGKVPEPVSYAILLLLTSYLGLYTGLYSLAVVWLRDLIPRYGIFFAPCFWVALELLRTYLLSGMPWCLLGYSQYRELELIQVADHTGVYGISFLIVLVNLALAELVLWLMPFFRGVHPVKLPWELLTTAASCMVLSWVYSSAVLNDRNTRDPNTSITVGVVQPNIDQAVKWDKAFRNETMQRFDRLTAELGTGTDLVVWPEAATPFILEREKEYQAQLVAWAERAQAPLLLGSPALRFYPDRRPYLLNSAYLLGRDGTLLGRYDKYHLVPFGEYIPLKSSLLFFLDKLVEGIGDFEAGPGPTTLSFTPKSWGTEGSPGSRPVKFGVAICYEVIFPDLVRQFAANGAEFLVTITNDGWFGPSSAPAQHFAMVVFRSVENHVAFARAANTGISGFIDPFGQIIHTTPLFTEQASHAVIPTRHIPTFYSYYGDVFAYACVILCALLCLFGYFRSKEPVMTAITPA